MGSRQYISPHVYQDLDASVVRPLPGARALQDLFAALRARRPQARKEAAPSARPLFRKPPAVAPEEAKEAPEAFTTPGGPWGWWVAVRGRCADPGGGGGGPGPQAAQGGRAAGEAAAPEGRRWDVHPWKPSFG